MSNMTSFVDEEKEQLSALLKAAGLGVRPVVPFPVIRCPVCHQGAILRYRYSPPGKAWSLISYFWCDHCWRYTGSTGPMPDWWDGFDALSTEEHATYAGSGMAGLERMLRRVATIDGGVR